MRMDELHRLEAKGLARAKLNARRRRVRAIRARATVGSAILFALTWAIVFGQLATGNDPVLNRAGPGARRPVASIHRRSQADAVPPAHRLAREDDDAPVAPMVQPALEGEPEPAPEEVELALEPEPAPVITSAS
jgi:hypothetical protein